MVFVVIFTLRLCITHTKKIVKEDVFMSGFHSFLVTVKIFLQDGVHFLFSNLIKLFCLSFRSRRECKFSEILRMKTMTVA